ncbi:MAG: hypothetical protein RLW68_08185 [Devosia marina]|uniref:PGN_0703 family putative restriction endonuclease n=1 Tax=Devosia marina TaxID=2683198 RepID=UPI0032EAE5F2
MAALLPGVPADEVLQAYADAPGDEIGSGKFASPRSSAALAANLFGWFIKRPELMLSVPGTEATCWPVSCVRLEATVRFPWSGGMHPCLDALLETEGGLIGIESKRYEPWRRQKTGSFSNAYRRPVWGERMSGYQRMRDRLIDDSELFRHLDAFQLVKHALALRTELDRTGAPHADLVYLFAEPEAWPDGRTIMASDIQAHRREVQGFREAVIGDEVTFVALSYRTLLDAWSDGGTAELRAHIRNLRRWSGL